MPLLNHQIEELKRLLLDMPCACVTGMGSAVPCKSCLVAQVTPAILDRLAAVEKALGSAKDEMLKRRGCSDIACKVDYCIRKRNLLAEIAALEEEG